jgi:biotin-dependent carboxylase-like uncharacterized protein
MSGLERRVRAGDGGWIEVVRGGAATTVQDLGRRGWRAHGVPGGGAADPWAARAANRLVGNPDGAALLEIVLLGPVLRFAAPARVAVVGGSFELGDRGRALPCGERLDLEAGAELRLDPSPGACRCWLAVAGGLDLTSRLGSRATELACGFGGLDGRVLHAGDRLAIGARSAEPGPRRVAAELVRGLTEPTLRVLSGPDADAAGAGGAATLVGPAFRVGARSDRRGVRLEGRRIASSLPGELRSQGVLPGAVQLPPSGEPIVLGVDAPVTGGYPWIAQVVEADLGRLAHLAPGATVRFETVDLDAAERALAERERGLAEGIVAA